MSIATGVVTVAQCATLRVITLADVTAERRSAAPEKVTQHALMGRQQPGPEPLHIGRAGLADNVCDLEHGEIVKNWPSIDRPGPWRIAGPPG